MKAKVSDNMSYKFVALGVALILWMSMLGRKDSTLTKDFELQLLLPQSVELATPPPQIVKVEIAGPRVAMKRINQMAPLFTVDLTGSKPGRQQVQLTRDGLNLPIGARILSIEPHEFFVNLRASKPPADEMEK